jgi:methylphosphotriester-DNA--protein-cysteine methyltransferase
MSEKLFKLLDSNRNEILSPVKGAVGGHRKLKIYGRLDCPSALRYIQNGHYVEHRVFFRDEATAVAAGYRPCGNCMPEAHAAWKRRTT